ncbi:MAG: efflux RND transporter periplasmic adaptor subunit [Bacteroidota bacterium]
MSKTKRKYIITGGILVLLLAGWTLFSPSKKDGEQVTVTVKKGEFLITVTSTGELQAKNSENILGPVGMRNAGVWQVKISDLVPEGTVVKAGDYIATLDRVEISAKLKDLESELEKTQSLYTKTQLDTALELRTARDELINLKYAMEEKKLVLDQSKYEPPATIRQAEIELDKATRAYEQAQKNYTLKQQQSVAKMSEVSATLSQQQRKMEQTVEVVEQFVIVAPKAGMVIYKRDWDGKKISVGSTISPWDPTVATLPDLTKMISLTYINEIDISKVKVDQTVSISIDAFPDKKFTGKVYEVANVGEQLPKSDAKVFEVRIQINETDTTLRPAMTTSNIILTARIPGVLSVPQECIHTEQGKTFVYKSGAFGAVKQEVKTGQSNDNSIIIEKGLEEGDEVYLSVPDNAEKIDLTVLQ